MRDTETCTRNDCEKCGDALDEIDEGYALCSHCTQEGKAPKKEEKDEERVCVLCCEAPADWGLTICVDCYDEEEDDCWACDNRPTHEDSEGVKYCEGCFSASREKIRAAQEDVVKLDIGLDPKAGKVVFQIEINGVMCRIRYTPQEALAVATAMARASADAHKAAEGSLVLPPELKLHKREEPKQGSVRAKAKQRKR